ncbi:DUF72 domain-containing protein [Staphylococcus sp. 17KM0847]|uniref:DUF72 domain-containing protein n=1 Tax=Staphylococcus sp. 17KM0847 TaxID=2583989 RepID=UPI0015DC49DA|nr:DUF72 domain-containing protein [Staphylococcus sp. 17KM0847]QLK85588.1 DUF72 domain-containing protein [Staphylococcus sp. 17KM0847]
MIQIGLTGWGDHDTLYDHTMYKGDKLQAYASHFPVVELDASYYAIQPERNIQKWIDETPQRFKFVVKIHQALTLHADYREYVEHIEDLFEAFRLMIKPLYLTNKLAMVLVQFPPWFDCTTKNINYIRYVRQQLQDIPVCIEFRHRSWFDGAMKERTLEFLTTQKLIHSVCDEPQAGEGCIPFVNRMTQSTALIRLHGRNVHGWTKKDMTDQEWRNVRYLYQYSDDELMDLAEHIRILEQKAEQVYVIFNNNSGGHAAGNAKVLQHHLGIDYEGLAPQQLKLF